MTHFQTDYPEYWVYLDEIKGITEEQTLIGDAAHPTVSNGQREALVMLL